MKTAQTAQRLRTCLIAGGALFALLTTTVAKGQATLATDEDVVQMGIFEVNTSKDKGYLKTNSVTASKIGAEIQKVPMNVDVLGEDFVRDTRMTSISDILNYTATGAGDEKMGILQPATGATPTGNISLRGFPINTRLRNGIKRYIGYNLDTVDRVEIVNGPVAAFFGQGYPGGVINYLTKKPVFSKIPTVISYSYGGNDLQTGSQRATMDTNQAFGKTAALRIVGAWDNQIGDQRDEYITGYSIMPTLTINPFKTNIFKINISLEKMDKKQNQNDQSWVWNQNWFNDYANADTIWSTIKNPNGTQKYASATAYKNAIYSNYNTWLNDVRNTTGNTNMPGYTSMQRGAYYNNSNGNLIQDKKFNYYGPQSYMENDTTTLDVTVELSPVKWLDIRYTYTHDDEKYWEQKATAAPQADRTFNALSGVTARDYLFVNDINQIDAVVKFDVLKIKNKVLFGGVYRIGDSRYGGTATADLSGKGQFPFYGNLPGIWDKPDEGYIAPVVRNIASFPVGTPLIPAPLNPATDGSFNYLGQYVRDRNGKIMTPTQIYSNYDPGVHPYPSLQRVIGIQRPVVDHYKPKNEDFYINYQGSAINDRLTVFGAWRREKSLPNGGQLVDANSPWYTGGTPVNEMDPSLWIPYGFGDGYYAMDSIRWYQSDSYMLGASFAITKAITVYASWNKTGYINAGTYGGNYKINDVRARVANQLNTTDPAIIEAATTAAMDRLAAEGGQNQLKPENGVNWEAGIKVDVLDQKIVGTFSIFRAERKYRKIDDTTLQADEPLNYLYDWSSTPPKTSYNRIIRWYSNDSQQRVEGAELEAIWTPIRNYQMKMSTGWLWTAKTVSDNSLKPGTQKYDIVYNNRIPNAPEFRFNVVNKYTVTNGLLRNLNFGLNMRYASEIVIDNTSVDYDPRYGGLTAGNYVVFDANIGYPWELCGYKFTTQLVVTNIFNREYSSGNANLGAPITWMLSTYLSF